MSSLDSFRRFTWSVAPLSCSQLSPSKTHIVLPFHCTPNSPEHLSVLQGLCHVGAFPNSLRFNHLYGRDRLVVCTHRPTNRSTVQKSMMFATPVFGDLTIR